MLFPHESCGRIRNKPVTAAMSKVHFLPKWTLMMQQAGDVCLARGHQRMTDGLMDTQSGFMFKKSERSIQSFLVFYVRNRRENSM